MTEHSLKAKILASIDAIQFINNPCKYKDSPWGHCSGPVRLHGAMTQYHWDPNSGEPDPNADFICCDAHYEEYEQYWKEMWSEYYSSVL